MTTLTLEIAPDLYLKLQQEANRAGQSITAVAETLLRNQVSDTQFTRNDVPSPAAPGERERARNVLRAAGLLTQLGPEEQLLANQSTATLEEVQAIWARVGGTPLSEIILVPLLPFRVGDQPHHARQTGR